MTDLAIVGSGPSALTAAIYAARDGLAVQVFEKSAFGGIISTSDFIENYPGFEEGISGLELGKKMRLQAQKFGAKISYGEVSDIQELENCVKMKVDGEEFSARAVLLAVGNSYRQLGLPREDEFFGRGIHFCATCDGPFYAGKDLIVVGGGNSAVQEAMFLARTSKVKMLVRSKLSAQEILLKRLEKFVESGKIEIFEGAQITDFLTEKSDFGEKITGAKVKQGEKQFEIHAAAVFEFIGLIPNTGFLTESKSGVELNEYGEIKVDKNFKTNKNRIFASGDAVENAEKQAIIAAASGAKAAIEIAKMLHGEA